MNGQRGDRAAYVQLFLGWMTLCLSTLSLCVVPESAVFYGLSHQLINAENIVIYGFMLLGEISLLIILLVLVTVCMSAWRRTHGGMGYIHLIVDPAIVAVLLVPVLTVRGLSTAHTIHTCAHSHYRLLQAISNITSLSTIPPPGECRDNVFDRLLAASNATALDVVADGIHSHIMVAWVASLQCLLLLPIVLRHIRYRWQMTWQVSLQSGLFLLVQALDTASLEATMLDARSGDDNLETVGVINIVVISVAATALSLACTALLTPPMYMGDHVTGSYMCVMMVTGCLVCDVPFLTMRFLTLYHGGTAVVSGVFPFVFLKNVTFIVFLLCVGTKRLHCLRTPYENLTERDNIHMIVQTGIEEDNMDDFV